MQKLVQDSGYFYNASVKPATAIIKSFKCHFTTTDGEPDTNLVTVCSSMLNVYKLEKMSVEIKVNSQFNDKIVDCIPITVSKPLSKMRQRRDIDTATLAQVDLLFILTQNFNCALVYYCQETNSIQAISRGNLSEKGTGERRQRPYPIFLSQDSKFILLMLYENVIKVIPLASRQDSQYPIQLTNAQNLRIKHSDVTDIIPLYQQEQEQPCFAVLYQRMEHGMQQGRICKRVKKEIEKHYYDAQRGDLSTKGEKLTLASDSVYKIVSLVFGGFLCLDIDQIAYCSGDFKQPLIYRKLRTPLTVKAICQVDSYDPLNRKTKEGHTFMRYLLATEAGELFMLAFHLDLLNVEGQEQRAIVLEFLASELSSASSLTYLDNNYVFYASANSDSHILEVTTELQPDLKRPFLKISETFQSLAPICDLSLANPFQKQGMQQELMITSGLNHQTFMSLVKKGIQLHEEFNFTQKIGIPAPQQILACDNLVLIQCFDYEMPLCLNSSEQEWQGVDLPKQVATRERFIAFLKVTAKDGGKEKPNIIHQMSQDVVCQIDDAPIVNQPTVDKAEEKVDVEMEEEVPKFWLIVSESKLKILNEKLEYVSEKEGRFDKAIQVSDKEIALVQQNSISIVQFNHEGDLEVVSVIKLNSLISAVCCNTQSKILYVCEYDQPFYTLSVLKNFTQKVHSVSLAQYMDLAQVRKYFRKKQIIEDRVFNESPLTPADDCTTMSSKPQDSSACVDIAHLLIDQVDTLVLAFANGKVLKLQYQVDSNVQKTVIEQCQESLNQQLLSELGQTQEQVQSAFSNPQTFFVGTIQSTLHKIQDRQLSEAILLECDKPAVFFQDKDKVDLHYLQSSQIRSVQQINKEKLIFVEQNQLILGQLDILRKLQLNRVLFKKQITKSLLLPELNSIAVLLEEPDLAYIDDTKNAVNLIAIVSRDTFQAHKIFKLDKTEVPNCLYFNQTQEQGALGNGMLMVGTTYVRLEEQVPSSGRLLFLNPTSLELEQEFKLDGSVQSAVWDQGKYITIAINNKVRLCSLNKPILLDKSFQLEIMDQKQTGTFIHSLTKLGEFTIVVADLAGSGICTYDILQQRQGKMKLAEAASSHISIWANQVVAISENQFIVFDQSHNMLIFEKHMAPTNLDQKYKLKIIGNFCLNEEVKSACFGHLRLSSNPKQLGCNQVLDKKRQHYIPSQTIERSSNEDIEMQEEDAVQIDENLEILMRQDINFAKNIFKKSIVLLEQHLGEQQLMYGTAEGSLGTIFRLPNIVYFVLNWIQSTMDKLIAHDLTMVKRSEYRSCHHTILQFESSNCLSQNIIDGDFVEQFLLLNKPKQLEVTKKMLNLSKSDDSLTSLTLQLIQELVKLH